MKNTIFVVLVVVVGTVVVVLVPEAGDTVPAIAALRQLLQQDRRALVDPRIKAWLGRRWRNLFLQAAAQDRQALKTARSPGPRGCCIKASATTLTGTAYSADSISRI